jgi:Bacterial Ig-like domain (group 3)
VTLTATITSTTSGTPSGMVNFYDNGTTLLNASPIALASGVASISVTLAPNMQHAITAQYMGDTNFLSSTSAATASVVTVTPLTFSLTSLDGLSGTVIPGHSIGFNFSITPTYGLFPGAVTFTATGLPPGATYTFNPASVPATSTGTNVVLTITVPVASAANVPPIHRQGPLLAFALGLLLLPLSATRRFRKACGKSYGLVLLLIAAGAMAGLTGCGAGNGILSQTPHSYAVTVTATSGGVQQSSIINLVVE